ncbi:alpha/beta fold hydrolase [Rhodovulum sp. DZ06]|uniref:alpha/beta fold hydrolase n=1 Tax=Rhodovulum sp. DZ06 TaxID=3425126 RepID=UPI003D32F476
MKRLAPLLLLVLAACAGGGAMDPRPPLAGAELRPAPVPDPEGENQRLTAPPLMFTLAAEAPGATLPVAHWPAEGETKAVLLALHGYGDYGASTFGRAARAWAARGIAAYAPDQRGFGRAPGRMRWPGAETLPKDAAAAFAAVAARHPGTPVFVAGHSMGGAVALAAAGRGGFPGAAGLILLAPAVWGGDNLNPILRLSAWSAAQIAPDKRWTGEGVVEIQPTDDWDMLVALSRDPLHYAAPSGREFLGLVRLMDEALDAAPGADLPALILLGENEEVVSPASVEALPAALPGPARLEYAPGGWHMLLRDRGASRVWSRVADWMLAPTPPAETPDTPAPQPGAQPGD